MSFARVLLGLTAVVVTCGVGTAKPPGLPIGPLPEGRELDPVARDYYLAEAPPAASEDSAPGRVMPGGPVMSPVELLATLHDVIIEQFTIPLGTVPPGGSMR